MNDARAALFLEIRASELNAGAERLPPGARVLELGGGSGWQAQLLSGRGFSVTSIDIASRPSPAHEYFPVETYDGVHVPYPDDSFDAVFSSNVLEHVGELPALLGDVRRVLRPGGVGVHLMPTPVWRFWTTLTYYEHLARRIVARLRPGPDVRTGVEAQAASGSQAPRPRIRDFLFAGPHGTWPTARAELRAFGPRRWEARLRAAGFDVVDSTGAGLFYTGHLSIPQLRVDARRRLAAALGSSCWIYVTR